jgi:gas vesicle protein
MTLQTVEGIIDSTDIDAAQGQTSWESKMEKFVNLGHAYSSVNTVTGEMCYMVDTELYRNILLAVAAKKQNERYLATAAEKLEQHIEQIGNSNGRIMKGESDMLARMSQRINESFDVLRDEHNTRMKNVMADIRALNDSMVASAEHNTNSNEM